MFPSRQEPRCRADGKHLGLACSRGWATCTQQLLVRGGTSAHPSSCTRHTSAPHPPPAFPLSQLRGSQIKSSSSARNKKGWQWELFPKGVHQPCPGLRRSCPERGRGGHSPSAHGTNGFPHSALHAVPLASWASINPFLSQEPAFGVRGMLSSPGEVQSPPSQPLLRHSPLLHGDFWLLLPSTLPSFSARFTLPRHL